MKRTIEDVAADMLLSPVHVRLGLELVQMEPTVIMRMPLNEEVQGPVPGSVHGGMLATLADVASALALDPHYEAFVQVPVTTDLHIRYYAQPRSGPVTAESRVVHAGRRLLSVESEVTDGEGRTLARSTATYMLVDFPR